MHATSVYTPKRLDLRRNVRLSGRLDIPGTMLPVAPESKLQEQPQVQLAAFCALIVVAPDCKASSSADKGTMHVSLLYPTCRKVGDA